MIQSVLTIGAILTVASLVLSFILLKATPKEKFMSYIPGAVFFAAGLILLLFATFGKVEIMGAGLGGWGIASLFAAAIGLIITAILDSFQNAKA
ncbi:hypothetical protein [Virgibacillus alimentarius]|uniref:Branched-subunit amino acid transport protein AzlD n=1 Tax=Virgibacillus alimentarius TaxID=698769 RepID=A0ABS4SBV1_9BACI|nr:MULTISPECIES: hypothetical protein [Virgibacillus]MBP2257872.1 branched-subunit amino acid transport protein AzlD [Virgibacillus alimentarius]HLR68301.1 hypothetical protein [Virgibacillus sp.]